MASPDTLIQFDRLRDRLIGEGVARRHVRRLLGELADHYEDAVRAGLAKGLDTETATAAAWQRLGSEDEIAASILALPELRSLPARFPRTISAAGPILLWVGITIASCFLLAGFTHALQTFGLVPPPRTSIEPIWLQNLLNVMAFAYLRVLPVAIGAGIAFTFARHLLVPVWTISGAVALSLLSGFLSYSLTFPTEVGQAGALQIGWAVSSVQLRSSLMFTAMNICSILVVYWLARRSRGSRHMA